MSHFGSGVLLDQIRNNLSELLLSNLVVHKWVVGRKSLVEECSTKGCLNQLSVDTNLYLRTECKLVDVKCHLSFCHGCKAKTFALTAWLIAS